MNTYTIQWSEYLRAGNPHVPEGNDSLCSGFCKIIAEDEDDAISLFKSSFPNAWAYFPPKCKF
jgi:hypothetical protein